MHLSSLTVPVDSFFNTLLQNSSMGCWVFDIQNRSSWWSDSYYDMLKLADKNKNQSLDDFLDHVVHPSDRHLVTTSIKNYLYHHAVADKHEVRLKNGDGEYNWYELFSEAKYDDNATLLYVYAAIVNINPRKRHQAESKKLQFILDVAEEMIGIGVLELNFLTGERFWSKNAYDILELPYDSHISLLNRNEFFNETDETTLSEAIEELKENGKPFDLELRLITANKNSVWVRLMAKPVLDSDGKIVALRGMIQKIERQKLKENFLIDIRNKITEQKFFLDETSAMSKVGGWEVNLETGTIFWAEQTRALHEVPDNYVPNFEQAISFYNPSSKRTLLQHMVRLIDHNEPFDLELELTTAQNKKLWVHSNGKPVMDKSGKTIKIRGVIQDITAQKQHEIELTKALSLINDQNNKLKDFAYIVSHNLRSHTGNLKMISDMIEMETDWDIKMQWVEMIQQVSLSLNQTVTNLTGIVNLATESKRRLYFQDVLSNLQNALNYKLINEDVELEANFSECEYIDYIPAYLESIMLNLVTNAIKYKHPKRKPRISLHTSCSDKHTTLRVKDNGQGIDLSAHGGRLFKMNQTFHQNKDARGIGLFITKNQVESMGGTIEVESIPEEGTTFTIHF